MFYIVLCYYVVFKIVIWFYGLEFRNIEFLLDICYFLFMRLVMLGMIVFFVEKCSMCMYKVI